MFLFTQILDFWMLPQYKSSFVWSKKLKKVIHWREWPDGKGFDLFLAVTNPRICSFGKLLLQNDANIYFYLGNCAIFNLSQKSRYFTPYWEHQNCTYKYTCFSFRGFSISYFKYESEEKFCVHNLNFISINIISF